ncbi:MAG TPA: ribonuclease III [Clostridiaceae bacterium]|nr:ribonuclease III [Clostridiaceae bacterium]
MSCKIHIPEENIIEIEKSINYTFKDKRNLILALTHSSYANEVKAGKLDNNERLEFLGDSILNATISETLFFRCEELNEGELTKIRANIVCEASLKKCADKIELGKHLLLGKGEELTGGRTRASVLSDAFEALVGAIFIDGGINAVHNFILDKMENIINDSVNGIIFTDYKTTLQEIIQSSGDKKITYEIVSEKGPDHDKLFEAEVLVSNDVMGRGIGKSKKEAEQNAAKNALEKISKNEK